MDLVGQREPGTAWRHVSVGSVQGTRQGLRKGTFWLRPFYYSAYLEFPHCWFKPVRLQVLATLLGFTSGSRAGCNGRWIATSYVGMLSIKNITKQGWMDLLADCMHSTCRDDKLCVCVEEKKRNSIHVFCKNLPFSVLASLNCIKWVKNWHINLTIKLSLWIFVDSVTYLSLGASSMHLQKNVSVLNYNQHTVSFAVR